jgi:uncharacterized protein YndB with AHSA1/START domain
MRLYAQLPSLLVFLMLLLFLTVPPAPALAEVAQSSPAGLTVQHALSTAAAPADVFKAIPQVDRWWSGKHTFSGSAANLSLKAEAGGCFCERWAEGSVEHGRVVQVMRDKLVRLQATLGPLMPMGVSGTLSFALKPQGSGTALEVAYRVSGDPSHNLRALGAAVDKVLGEQAQRLVRFAETGKAD